jgi:hypothetical protein
VKKIGGASSKGWAESAPLVGIGLTDHQTLRGAVAPPPSGSGSTELKVSQIKKCQWIILPCENLSAAEKNQAMSQKNLS